MQANRLISETTLLIVWIACVSAVFLETILEKALGKKHNPV